MKNLISCLWEELEVFFLKDDEDFKIIKIEDEYIEIKALNKRAFNVNMIYRKILGPIIPYNCFLKLKSSYIQAKSIKDDLLLFKFTIKTKKCFYKGNIKVSKNKISGLKPVKMTEYSKIKKEYEKFKQIRRRLGLKSYKIMNIKEMKKNLGEIIE